MEAHTDIECGTIPVKHSMTLIGTCRRLDDQYWFPVRSDLVSLQSQKIIISSMHCWRIDFDFDLDSRDLNAIVNRCSSLGSDVYHATEAMMVVGLLDCVSSHNWEV